MEIVSTPNSSTERLSLYQQILSARSDDIDVLQIDVVWPGLLANHLLDLQETLGKDAAAGHFETIVANNTVDGRLVAMPWFTDAACSTTARTFSSSMVSSHPRPGSN